jgi:hypothetical protein
MSLYVKHNDVWEEVYEVFVKEAGTWETATNVYIKDSDVWEPVLGGSGSQNYTTAGSNAFTVPAGIYTLTATIYGAGGGGGGAWSTGGDGWMGGGGGAGGVIDEKTFTTTPGEELTVVVGAAGDWGSTHHNNSWININPARGSANGGAAHGGDGGDSYIARDGTDIDSVEFTLSCSTVDGDATVTATTTTLLVGMKVSGTGIPAGATIESKVTGSFELSANATEDDTNDLTFSLPARAEGGEGGPKGSGTYTASPRGTWLIGASCAGGGAGGYPHGVGEDGQGESSAGTWCTDYSWTSPRLGGTNGTSYGDGGQCGIAPSNWNAAGTDGGIGRIELSW